jgi:hypothetical protein
MDKQHIEYDIDLLGMMLKPKKWHGHNIIEAGPFQNRPTPLQAFDDLVAHVRHLMAKMERLTLLPPDGCADAERAVGEAGR